MNTVMRKGVYNENLWKQFTGKTALVLDEEWRRRMVASRWFD